MAVMYKTKKVRKFFCDNCGKVMVGAYSKTCINCAKDLCPDCINAGMAIEYKLPQWMPQWGFIICNQCEKSLDADIVNLRDMCIEYSASDMSLDKREARKQVLWDEMGKLTNELNLEEEYIKTKLIKESM